MMLAKLFSGLAAGCVATLPMSVTMVLLHMLNPRDKQVPLPPEQLTDTVIAKTAGVQHTVHPQKNVFMTINHFGYGALAGGLYALFFSPLIQLPAAVRGILYGIVVWTGSYLGWIPALQLLPPATEQPPYRNLLMIIAHLVWGFWTGILTGTFNKKLPV